MVNKYTTSSNDIKNELKRLQNKKRNKKRSKQKQKKRIFSNTRSSSTSYNSSDSLYNSSSLNYKIKPKYNTRSQKKGKYYFLNKYKYYILVGIIILTLIIVLIVYLVNLNNQCNKTCINKQTYLDKDKCKCITCKAPSCGIGMWYDLKSKCVNSNKNPKEYECLPCPSCPEGKKPDINKPCGGSDPGSCIDNSAYTDNKSGDTLEDSSNNLFIILTIVIIVVLVISSIIYYIKTK
tara:strand:- start:135 stop:839 length:705 start_codon:yes stop_codon:yes gene_type:complete